MAKQYLSFLYSVTTYGYVVFELTYSKFIMAKHYLSLCTLRITTAKQNLSLFLCFTWL